jgi:lyso-ornithine lipid O-acyltransferase
LRTLVSEAPVRALPRGALLMPFKLVLLLAHLALGLALAYLIAGADLFRQGHRVPRERLAQWWHRDLLRILKVRIRRRGAPLRSPHLAVANHVSWLDIIVVGACRPTRFVSRHDVKDWPVAGTLADACGTFYVRRGGGNPKAALAAMTPHLQRGSIVVFPEGTTSDGTTVLPFRPRLFEAALAAGASVQPVALAYGPGDDGTAVAPFIGDMTLVGHIWRVLLCTGLDVEVRFGAALVPDDATTRDALAAQAHRAVERSVQMMRSRATNGERYQ